MVRTFFRQGPTLTERRTTSWQHLSAEKDINVQGFSDSLMNLSGAFGGAVSGTILLLYSFSGLNAAALLPVVLIVFATSFARNWR